MLFQLQLRPDPYPEKIMSTPDPSANETRGLYGTVPSGLLDVPPLATQCSPCHPGSIALGDFPEASLDNMIMHAPASTVERRHVLALALRALKPGGELTAFAPNNKGGMRLAAELKSFGCEIESSPRRHHQIVTTSRPQRPAGLDEAIEAGEPRLLPGLDLWSQPGLFSWDRIDPGSSLLLEHLTILAGSGADLGCGIGILARAVLEGGACRHMTMIDIDRRAVDMARRNVPSEAATTLWADVMTATNLPTALDFVVTNAPFHDGGKEDRTLGVAFIEKAAAMLRPEGHLWLTANRHLPYEEPLQRLFHNVEQVAQANGYKIYSARRKSGAGRATVSAGGSAERRRKAGPRR